MSDEKAKVGLFAATAIVVGNMIGTGVYTSLGFQVAALPSPFAILLLWIAGGIVALCGALSYAELAASLPRSGGEYHFLSRIWHPVAGFFAGWLSITVGFAAPVALAAMPFGKLLAGVLPVSSLAASCGLVVAVTAVHLFSVGAVGRFQSVFTAGKALLIVVIIVAGFTLSGGQEGVRFGPAKGDLALIFSGPFAISMYYVMYAYSGWNASTYIVSEVRNPQRLVPLSLLLGTALVAVLYAGLNAAFLYSTPMEELSGAGEGMAQVAAHHIFGERGGDAMTLLICFGLVSTVSAMTWAGPRVAQAMGEDHRVFAWFARTSEHGTPRLAVLWQAAIVIVLLLTSSFEQVLVYVQVLLLVSSLLVVLGLFWLRIREPDLERPFRAWGYPFTPLLFVLVSVWLLVYGVVQKPVESLWGLVTLLAGLAVYAVSRRMTRQK